MSTFDPRKFDESYQQAQTRQSDRGPSSWKVKEGRNVIRILPPHPKMEGDVIVGMRVHFSLGPNADTWAPCLEFFGEQCPACDWVTKIRNQGLTHPDPNVQKQMRDKAKDARAQWRYGMNIVDMAHPEAGVQKYYVGVDLQKRIGALFYTDEINPTTGRADVRDLSHPETGRDIILECEKKKMDNGKEYIGVVSLRPKDTPTKLMDPAWVDQVFNLMDDRFHATTAQVAGAIEGKRIERGAAPQGALVAPAAAPLPPLPQARVITPPLPPANLTPPPTPAPRGPGRPPKAQQQQAAAAPAAQPIPETPATVIQRTRQPLGSVQAPPAAAGPRAAARAMALAVGFTPGPNMDITEAEIATLIATEPHKMPPCYKIDPDPKEGACQGCSLLLSCMSWKHGLDPAA